ncbi:jg15 [Pararge aegeria aegeria]|uniref:Jg15 protein n=1 Tax=Pararge aegeria aegeria TaxID=348720 RepID=A0A8S4QZU2_9NEOP|nr:jg15 [Pararge aegeria aegeria]
MRRSVEELELPTSTSREAKVAMGAAHRSENRWMLGFQGVRVAPRIVFADPQRDGQTKPSKLQSTCRTVAPARVVWKSLRWTLVQLYFSDNLWTKQSTPQTIA